MFVIGGKLMRIVCVWISMAGADATESKKKRKRRRKPRKKDEDDDEGGDGGESTKDTPGEDR